MGKKTKPVNLILSSIGRRRLDCTGSPVGVARMDPSLAYSPISSLLKDYIDNGFEGSWNEIRTRIDNIYATVSVALDALEYESKFCGEVTKRIHSGQKLFFKPNHVILPVIDYRTHNAEIRGVCTPWEFAAAVMRWFHDKAGVTYHQMALGEAGTTTTEGARIASELSGTRVTSEAIFEGKYGNYYGGWGFYFARKYLQERHDPKHTDDPMSGYQESLVGVCLPPGKVTDKLLIYDLNKVNESTGREVPVASGVNFKNITMHKAIIGGDPSNEKDIADWPGCVLVSLPKLKIHNSELFTCALKNLGMGLYSIFVNASKEPGKYEWKYSGPNLSTPANKLKVPHYRWRLELDKDTLLPMHNNKGKCVWNETGGMEATIADSLQAVKGENIMTMHVVDAIETSNISHVGLACTPVPEGYVFAGTDPVAVDECCSRYLFTMTPLDGIDKLQKQYGLTSDVIQKVPMPKLDGNNIVTGEGYDSCFSRFNALNYCEKRGLGQRRYYAVGEDLWHGGTIACLNQHLGKIKRNVFTELTTSTMYYTTSKVLHDLQSTIFAYLESNDKLTGSDFKRKVLDSLDENGDGIIDYLDRGKVLPTVIEVYKRSMANQKLPPAESMKLMFLLLTIPLKHSRKDWNTLGNNIGESVILTQALNRAFAMSKSKEEKRDPMFPGRMWGDGKWPSFQYALQLQLFARIYGELFPKRFDDMAAMYGLASKYAKTKNDGSFTFYVPQGLGSFEGIAIPNVKETDNPELIFTASFADKETWKELHLSAFSLK